MQIREADRADSESIRDLYLQAFDESEAQAVAELALDLLEEKTAPQTRSLVALQGDAIVGHVVFSPVWLGGKHFASILAPLAVLPAYQKRGVGSALVNCGLDSVAAAGSPAVFVYGDPNYYGRFGFDVELAKQFEAPHPLQYPHGWLALHIGAVEAAAGGTIRCVASLDKPDLW